EETAVHFHLEPLALGTLNGKVIDENTGTPVEGASIYLIEDANIQSGKTDANGSFTMTPYEGTYTMRVIAPGYYTVEKTVTIIGDTVTYEEVALTPISGLTHEIAYDDGSEEYRNAWYGPGNGWAVKMTLADGKDSAILSATKLKFNHEWPNPGGTAFKLYIYDTSGPNGEPGNIIAGPFDGEAIRSETEWTYIDLSHEGIEVGKEFFVVYIQHLPQTESPGISVDRDGPFSGRSWRYLDGEWRQLNENEGNYMIRAIVNYDTEVPVLTSPSDGLVTTENHVTIEGNSTPNTDIHIYNNGEEVAVVQSDNEGLFSETLTL